MLRERNLEVLKLQNSARNSTEWFETLERYTHFEPLQFAYSLLTRSQRISHENLRLRDREWLEGVERWFWKRATDGRSNKTAPPMFAPFTLREMTVENRVTVSPMAMYSAVDGTPNDFHFVHYGERAMGGAGLVFTEMTCVSPEGRISPGCTGLWNDEQAAAWKRIVDFVHANSKAKLCLQLGHSGAKGSNRVGWEEDNAPLADGNWPIIAASDVPWSPVNQVPTPMSRADMDKVRDEFVAAVRLGVDAGFDMVELHAAHGYLLSGFLTPLQNKRTDEYGGSLENRLRYPLEVFAAMRAAWPSDRPMSVRISATDWAGEDGITPDDAVEIAEAFAREGADLIDVSAGQTWTGAKPVYGRMFQTPFSDKLRNENSAGDDGGRQYLRARPRQFDPRRRARGPGRFSSSAFDRSVLDAARGRPTRVSRRSCPAAVFEWHEPAGPQHETRRRGRRSVKGLTTREQRQIKTGS